MPHYFDSDYLDITVEPKQLNTYVAKVARNVRSLRNKQHFDAIAFMGMSGAAIAYPVSLRTGIPLILVRKGKSHSMCQVEGPHKAISSYLIVDDLVDSGNTIAAIVRRINKETKRATEPVKCVGVLLYNQYDHYSVERASERLNLKFHTV